MRFKLKMFTETRWYARQPDGTLALLADRSSASISDQVNDWVDATGAILTHPGQPGMETTWYTDKQEQQLCSVSVSLAVLYQDGGSGVRANNPGAAS